MVHTSAWTWCCHKKPGMLLPMHLTRCDLEEKSISLRKLKCMKQKINNRKRTRIQLPNLTNVCLHIPGTVFLTPPDN